MSRESKLDLSNVSFEDVLEGTSASKSATADVEIPDKPVDLDTVTTPEPVIPKKEVDEPEPDESGEGTYESLNKLLGYEVEGEFDESVEGIADYTKAVATKIAQEELKDLFSTFPDVKEYLEYRLNNGSPDKYFESKFGESDYSKYTNITESDETTQEVIVRKYLAQQNFTDEEINETIRDYKDTGLLYKTAKKAADKLVASQKTRKEELIMQQAERAREEEAKRTEVIGEITDVVEKGKLKNLVIPEKDRKEFKSWLLNPDAKGQTKRQATMSKLSMQEKLELEYLVFKGFNLNDLVKTEVTKTRIDFLKKGATSKQTRLSGTGKETKTGNKQLDQIKLTDIL